MKRHTKQILALLLAVCTLATFAMPTVFAVQDAETPAPAPAPVPESVTYQFYDEAWKDDKISAHTAEIKAAFDAGTLNWRYEAASSGYQFNRNNKFASGLKGMEFVCVAGGWIAVRIQSPGAGRFDLTLTHGAYANGAAKSGVYIVKADAIDAVLGENSESYAEAMSQDPYQENGATNAFKAFSNAVTAAMAEKDAVMSPVFYAETVTKDLTATGSFVFQADTEYVVIFKSEEAQVKNGNAYVMPGSLTATYSEDQSGIEEIPEPTTYQFYKEAWKDAKISAHTAEIKAAFDAGTLNWRYEAAHSGYQFNRNNSFASGLKSMEYVTAKGGWIAVRVQSPGEGNFDLTLTYAAHQNGAAMGEVYIVPAELIDAALGEKAESYAEAMSADPYQENGQTDAFKAYSAAVTAAVSGKEAVIEAAHHAAAVTTDLTATGKFRFEKDTEYVVVFKAAESYNKQDNAYLMISALTATYSEDQDEPVEPSIYRFYNDAWQGTMISAQTAGIKAAYDAGTLNWRYEAAHSGYQFNRNNKFASGLKSMEYVTGRGGWIAVRIQSPGAGKFDLTLTHGAYANGAAKGDVYIIPASAVDEALGENAAAYAEAMSADPYQENGQTDAFLTYFNVINAMIGEEASVMSPCYYAAGVTRDVTATGSFRFEADQEYVVVFKAIESYNRQDNAYLMISSLTAEYSEDQSGDSGEGGETPTPPTPPADVYTDGLYDFYAGSASGSTLADGIEDIAAKYDAGVLNWKYETHSGMRLDRTDYERGTNSLRFISTATWWVAFRVKAPAVDGSYNIQMTHGAGGQGAAAGEIYVIPGDTETKDIPRVMNQKGAAMTTDWFYGENTGDLIAGRQSGVGTVNMEAGKEYIVIFLPTATSNLSENGFIWLGQLQATRVGDLVEEEGGEEGETANYYEFYHWDYPGQYLIHYRTEEELGAKIVTEEIAQEYNEGKINWRYEKSNGYASFSTGTPYMETMIGEMNYFALRIKAPGTGTYQIDYTHYTTRDAKAGDHGYVYVLPVPANKTVDYNYIKDECDFRDPIITTSYKADKNGFVTVTGEYTSFKEDQEFLICFAVADTDKAKEASLRAYPQSMKMTRTGEWKPEPGEAGDDGIVYNLFLEEYANKTLWHSSDRSIFDAISKRFEEGSLNWKMEGMAGSAYYTNRYVRAGTDSRGGAIAFRVRSPGTGKYNVTLKYFLGSDVRDADGADIYIVEAPKETLDIHEVADKMARAPMMTTVNSHDDVGMKKASGSGTYNFQEDKDYYVIFYLSDVADTRNTSGSCWVYLDRLVMKRIGEFEPEPEHITLGGLAVKDAVSLLRTADGITITEVNGHDYMTLTLFGATMMIYDLDEWRLVDEVYTGIETPYGVVVDQDGKIWVTGDNKTLYCYDPYTQTGFNTERILQGGQAYVSCCGDDGYLYFSTMSDYGAYIYRFNPRTQEYTVYNTQYWSKFCGDMIQKGDYIYTVASGEQRHEIWKLDKMTGKLISSIDITKAMKTTRYVYGVNFLDDNYLMVNTPAQMTIVDVRTMELLPQEKIGVGEYAIREVSGEIDGKRYFVTINEGLCYYDIATQTFGAVGGDLKNAKTGIRGKDYNLATIDDSRLPGTSIITYGGMTADGLNLYAYNPQSKAFVTLIGLVETSFAYGQNIREIDLGKAGSGDIYFGANYDAPVQVYNTTNRELMQEFATNGQADAFHWYKDQLYIGNYNGAILTRMEGNQPIALFRLNNDAFYQARIHSISSGDDKVFVGTVPHVYQNGGLLAWYDLNTELTYVVTGPNPEDVYYAKSSKVTVTNEWYSAVTNELVDMTKEWDKDENGDGVCQYFKGPIPLQSITKVIYRDGLLFGLAAPMGGTSSVTPVGESAKMFVYDVANMKMIKVVDIGAYISDLPKPLASIAALDIDPDISNKFWGVVAETLFSMTYDRDTGKVTIKEELSFDKHNLRIGNGWFANDILFQGDDMYVMFYKIGGLCRVNRNNPKEYEQLLYNFESLSQIPESMVIAEDGDLYYTTASPNLYVLNLDITEEERAIAKNVQDLIDIISDTVTMEDRPAIEAARAAWDAMAPANQPLVNNYRKLEDAEIELLRLRIAALGEITIEDEAELVAIRKAYSALSLEQRMTIDFLSVSKAESVMSILRGERMVNQIAAIGEVTLEKADTIRAARAAFMALSRYERTLVTNIEVLNTAEAILTGLILRQGEADAVEKLIDEIGFVFFSNEKIKIAREAYDKLDAETKAWVENYKTLTKAETLLIVEYVVVGIILVGGAAITVLALRKKASKKKANAE